MTPEEIRDEALAAGFKLKKQPDDRQDLNPYVFDFARRLIARSDYCYAKHRQAVAERDAMLATLERLQDLVTQDYESKEDFIGRVRLVLADTTGALALYREQHREDIQQAVMRARKDWARQASDAVKAEWQAEVVAECIDRLKRDGYCYHGFDKLLERLQRTAERKEP